MEYRNFQTKVLLIIQLCCVVNCCSNTALTVAFSRLRLLLFYTNPTSSYRTHRGFTNYPGRPHLRVYSLTKLDSITFSDPILRFTYKGVPARLRSNLSPPFRTTTPTTSSLIKGKSGASKDLLQGGNQGIGRSHLAFQAFHSAATTNSIDETNFVSI